MKLSDEEFIELWKKHASAVKPAKIIGIDPRNVHRRRRRVEDRYGISLLAEEPEVPVAQRYTARVHHEFQNGIMIVFSDAHFWPGIYSTAYKALLKFTDELKPKVIVCNGDGLDGASISRHPPIGWEHLPTVVEELEALRDHLGFLEAVAGKAKLVWPVGNHDLRYETRLASVASQYKGIKGFHLKDWFPKWQPCWSLFVNDAVCKHRFKGGLHSAFNNTLWSGKNIFTGHDHQLWDRAFRDYNGIRYGVDTGTLADVSGPQFVDYTEDNPTGWNSGFYVATFSKGIMLAPERVIVTDEGVVQFRGQEIKV